MHSFSDIISAWPSRTAMAEDCGTTYGVVKQWDRRASIPAEYWIAVIDGAERRGIPGITLSVLATIARAGGRLASPSLEPSRLAC